MKKKILSIVVAICLVSMALPMQTASVSAAGHIHCVCGATDCSGEGHDPSQEWQKWTTDNDLPVENGFYYLANDVTMTTLWDPYNADINICLNGHTIKFLNEDDCGVLTQGDTTLTITNCEEEGGIYSNSEYVVKVDDYSELTLINTDVSGYLNSSLIFVKENASLTADGVEGYAKFNEILDAIRIEGTALFDDCDFDVESTSSSAIIYNHGGTLTTNNLVAYLDATEAEDQEDRGVMNSDGIWYSTNDDIICEAMSAGYGAQVNGTAKTVIEDSHISGKGGDSGFGLQLGFEEIGSDDDTYIFGEANIEGKNGSIAMNHTYGLYASDEGKTEWYEGDPMTIFLGGFTPALGDVIVSNANASVLNLFSVENVESMTLGLDGTDLVLVKAEEPTTTQVTTTPASTTPVVTTEVPTSDVTTVAPTSNVETTTAEKETCKPTKIKKIKKGKKSAKLTWKKLSAKDITGYQIRYSMKKKMKKAKIKTVKKAKIGSIKIKKLKRKKKYFFQIRTYKDIVGDRIYSDWSKAKSVKIK